MFDLRLLWMLLLSVLYSTEGAILDCPPGKPEKTPVRHCNYYCGQNKDNVWQMGYYVNGTECEYGARGQKGICVQLPDAPGCHWPDDEDVKEFLKRNKDPSKKEKTKKKKPRKEKTTTSTKKPKKKKKKSSKDGSKKSKKTKKEKKMPTTPPAW
uniref:Basic tail secreted protein n=1 Tax=Rhipicephalus zambeziensis TaxID=60191 RepID=A0A224YCI3_9ACAR